MYIEFAAFRICLDSEMKRLQRADLGSRKMKAERLTIAEEELLWSKGLLGSGSHNEWNFLMPQAIKFPSFI